MSFFHKTTPPASGHSYPTHEVYWGRIVAAPTLFSLLLMAGCPRYNVWKQTLSGEAQLKEAEWNRQIAVQEANAKFESSKMLAAAEVERAKGVAEANKIIGESLNRNEAYLRYLWIQSLEGNNRTVVYVPTEANLPILEAERFGVERAK